MTLKERLKKEIDTRRRRLEDLEDAERRKEALPLLGRCFKSRTSGSLPEDYWSVYYRVTGVTDSGRLTTLEFQRQKDGSLTLGRGDWYAHVLAGPHTTPISIEEFALAWVDFQNLVAAHSQYVRKELPS